MRRCHGVPKRVLIVDDHEPFRAVARELLERAGYVVAGEAGDAAEALAAVAADAPDAVLLDVQLPDRDGFAVATALAAADGPAVVLDLVARGGRLRAAGGGVRRARLHPEVEALGGGVRRARCSDGVAGGQRPRQGAACCATRCCSCRSWSQRGLAVGWLGVHEHVSGTRIVADLALSWALAAAALVVLERPRWRRASWLLAAAAFAVLGADLEWASSHALVDARLPARGAVGRAPGSARAHVPGRAALVAPGPVRDRRRLRGHARRAARRRVRRSGRARPAVRRAAGERRPRGRPSAGDLRRRRRSGRALPRPAAAGRLARRGTPLAGAASGRGGGHHPGGPRVAGLGDRDRREHADARDDREGGCRVAPGRGRRRDRLVAPAPSGSVRARRRAANADGGDDARAARPGARRPHARGRLPARQRPLRRRGRPAGRAAARAATAPSRR